MAENHEVMDVDVLIVGGGPAGLAAACRLGQLCRQQGQTLSIAVLEKGSEIGAHIVSGAVFEPTALNELFPDWQQLGAPLNTPVDGDRLYFMTGPGSSVAVPGPFAPHTMHNRGNYIISLGELCRWLAGQAEGLGVDIFTGFPASSVRYDSQGRVQGVMTGEMGVAADGSHRDGHTPAMALNAKYTIFAEGSRGHLGKELISHFGLDAGSDPQHYALGIKELWQAEASCHRPGLVVHTAGWPLSGHGATGGGFLYHLDGGLLSLGLITDLNYRNPHLSPYDEFQRFKHHPLIANTLGGAQRLSYGARAITKGGPQSLPRMHFPGGLLVGCDAGTLNFAKIKGSHTAMKSAMVAAEVIFEALGRGEASTELADYDRRFEQSWAGRELHSQRNFGPAQHRLGNLLGGSYAFIDLNLLRGRVPWTLRDRHADHMGLRRVEDCKPIDYPKPDGKLSFDKASSVFLSNTNHEENQPCHLLLQDPELPISKTLPLYDEPAQRYCPAGVYEIVSHADGPRFQINAQNCVHCKTCDIKDPWQNIRWVPPEGGGGPNYPNM